MILHLSVARLAAAVILGMLALPGGAMAQLSPSSGARGDFSVSRRPAAPPRSNLLVASVQRPEARPESRLRTGNLSNPWSNRLGNYPITERQRQAACPFGGSPLAGGRCLTAPPYTAAIGGPDSDDAVDGWFRDLPVASYRQVACPPGTIITNARFHENVTRCIQAGAGMP